MAVNPLDVYKIVADPTLGDESGNSSSTMVD